MLIKISRKLLSMKKNEKPFLKLDHANPDQITKPNHFGFRGSRLVIVGSKGEETKE